MKLLKLVSIVVLPSGIAFPQCLCPTTTSVQPATASVAVGSVQKFTVQGTFSNSQLTVTANVSPFVTWTSSNPSVATVDVNGNATGLAAGTTTIQSNYNSVVSSGTLTVVVANFPGIHYDSWLDFEQDTLGIPVTSAQLTASTHGTAGTWDLSQSRNLFTASTAGEDPSHAITGDTGTRGLALNLGPGGQETLNWNLPSNKSALSFGLWYRTYTASAWEEGPHLITLYNFAYGPMLRFSDERSGATNARQFRVSPLDNAITAIADNTWYWLTMKWVQGGQGVASVYDANLNLIGTTTFRDNTNVPAQVLLIGNSSSLAAKTGQSTYFDDLIIDYTNATFPLLPKTIK